MFCRRARIWMACRFLWICSSGSRKGSMGGTFIFGIPAYVKLAWAFGVETAWGVGTDCVVACQREDRVCVQLGIIWNSEATNCLRGAELLYRNWSGNSPILWNPNNKEFCVLHVQSTHNYILPISTVRIQLHVSDLYVDHLQVENDPHIGPTLCVIHKILCYWTNRTGMTHLKINDVIYQVEDSASGGSLIRRSPTDCMCVRACVCLCVYVSECDHI